jgi:putative tryptophan/tyrosine transport system substrate-binding protein
MRRRDFIAGLGGAACGSSWPLALSAQQRLRLIGLLTSTNVQAADAAFVGGLAKAGWIEGRNVGIERRFSGSEVGRIRTDAANIIDKSPDVIVCAGTEITGIVKQQSSTIPVVFVNIADPVALGFVASFAHPGSNITGFTSQAFSFAGKWLSILKDIEPGLRNVMVLYDPNNANWQGFLRTLETGAPVVGASIHAAPAADIGEIERHIESFAHQRGAAMIVVPTPLTFANREMIAVLAGRHRLLAVYPYKFFATSGGLASYGADTNDLYRRAAGYVDRILRGEKPSDLPVQAPTKFELVINLKTAKSLGLTIPEALLATADEVIQ